MCAPCGLGEHGEEVPSRVDGSEARQRAEDDGPDDGKAGERGRHDGMRRHACRKGHIG